MKVFRSLSDFEMPVADLIKLLQELPEGTELRMKYIPVYGWGNTIVDWYETLQPEEPAEETNND